MKRLRTKFLLWFMQTGLFHWLLIRFIPYIRFTTYYTTLRGWQYQRGYKKLKPGLIILTTDRKKLTTVLIGGEITHAALCIGKGEEWEVSEMTHTNYTQSAFFDLCKEADRVLLLQCTDWDDLYTKRVIERCKSFKGCQYDTLFKLGIAALYCSELVYEADFEHRLKVSLEDIAGLGRPYISPTGLLHAKNVTVVWDSDQEKSWEKPYNATA